mgnify:CR=1 FL=1
MKIGTIGRIPANGVILPKVPEREMNILDEIQVNHLLAATYGHRISTLLHLAVETGMRQMELLGLKWSDIDWDFRTIKVQRQLLRARGKGIQFSQPKTKTGRRTIGLGSRLMEALKNNIEAQQGAGKNRVMHGRKMG